MKALKTKILWQIHFWVSGSGLFGGLGSREHCGLCLATIWFWSDQSNFAIWPYGQNSRLGRKWKYWKIQNIGVGISFKCVAAVLISWRMIAAAKTHLLLLFLLYVEHPTIFSNTLYTFLDALQSPQIPIPPLIVLRSISYLDKCDPSNWQFILPSVLHCWSNPVGSFRLTFHFLPRLLIVLSVHSCICVHDNIGTTLFSETLQSKIYSYSFNKNKQTCLPINQSKLSLRWPPVFHAILNVCSENLFRQASISPLPLLPRSSWWSQLLIFQHTWSPIIITRLALDTYTPHHTHSCKLLILMLPVDIHPRAMWCDYSVDALWLSSARPILPIKDGKEDGDHEKPRKLSLKAAPWVSYPDHLWSWWCSMWSWLSAWTVLGSSKAPWVPKEPKRSRFLQPIVHWGHKVTTSFEQFYHL